MFERCDEQEQTSVYGKVYFQQDLLFPACVIYHMQVFSLALLIQWLVFLLSLVHLTLSPFFLKVLRIFRTFKLLKDGCLNSSHFTTILLGSKIITNTKDTYSASEILFTTKLLFHEEIMERQFQFCGSMTSKQNQL